MCTTVKQQRTECLTSLKIDALMEQAARPPHVRLPEVHNMTQSKIFPDYKAEVCSKCKHSNTVMESAVCLCTTGRSSSEQDKALEDP